MVPGSAGGPRSRSCAYFSFLTSSRLPLVAALPQPRASQPVATSLTVAGPSESPGDEVDATVIANAVASFAAHPTVLLPIPVRAGLFPSCCPMLTVTVALTLREQRIVPFTTAVPVCSSTAVGDTYVNVSVSVGGHDQNVVGDSCGYLEGDLGAETVPVVVTGELRECTARSCVNAEGRVVVAPRGR